MKAIVLAAGVGSRLCLSLPKVLVNLNESVRIIDNHLRALDRYFAREQVVFTTGFQREAVEAAAPGCLFAYNAKYANTNTAASLSLALDHLGSEDFVLINGDVVYPPEALERLVRASGNRIGVRRGSISDEEVKFVTRDGGRITALSKTVADGEGEAVGINRFCAATTPLLKEALRACTVGDYFEAAIERLLPQTPFETVDLTDTGCIEVDFPSDLAEARATYAASWGNRAA